MSNPSNTPSAPRGLSLYANLLDPDSSTPGSISKGPVVFKPAQPAEEKKPTIDSSALRFQPTKRPQLSQKSKPKTAFPRPAVPDSSIQRTASPSNLNSSAAPAISRPTKTTLADWTGGDDEDVNGFYGGEKRQRGGRKHKKKKQREEHVTVQDWDDIYDPTRPNNYEEYKNSDEKVREVREWKDRLYAHRMARKASSDKSSDEEDYRPQMNRQFAPPGMSFAPPPIDSPAKTAETMTENTDSDSQRASIPPPPPPAEHLPPMPPPEPVAAGQISRAPVRYNLPPPPSDIPSSEAELEKALAEEEEEAPAESTEDAPRSLRPGQKGFAERLMSKYGWSKGKGLGADGSGIVNPLRVQVEKRKKKSDAEGGGFREPGGARGKIIGGKKNVPEKEKDPEEGKFGPMSEVIVLRGMVDGMDLEEEVGDGGLMQEIGDECGEKYGRVERVYIDRHGDAPKVFVKFTSQLSALRAVNALEGRNFSGNTISALFYETERFEQGIYD